MTSEESALRKLSESEVPLYRGMDSLGPRGAKQAVLKGGLFNTPSVKDVASSVDDTEHLTGVDRSESGGTVWERNWPDDKPVNSIRDIPFGLELHGQGNYFTADKRQAQIFTQWEADNSAQRVSGDVLTSSPKSILSAVQQAKRPLIIPASGVVDKRVIDAASSAHNDSVQKLRTLNDEILQGKIDKLRESGEWTRDKEREIIGRHATAMAPYDFVAKEIKSGNPIVVSHMAPRMGHDMVVTNATQFGDTHFIGLTPFAIKPTSEEPYEVIPPTRRVDGGITPARLQLRDSLRRNPPRSPQRLAADAGL